MAPLVAPVESNGSYRHLRVAPLNSPPPSASAACEQPDARTLLRRQLRERRAQLPAAVRAAAARAVARHIASMPWLQRGRPIGAYAAVGTEIDAAPLITLALRRGCPPYLPRIVDYRHRRLRFARLRGGLANINRHGIPEPESHDYLPVRALAVVFVPVLGFDARGTRLGSGAGYYDRLFAFRRQRVAWHRPLLIGLAYRCQQLPHIERHAFDVPLDLVVTEAGIIRCES